MNGYRSQKSALIRRPCERCSTLTPIDRSQCINCGKKVSATNEELIAVMKEYRLSMQARS